MAHIGYGYKTQRERKKISEALEAKGLKEDDIAQFLVIWRSVEDRQLEAVWFDLDDKEEIKALVHQKVQEGSRVQTYFGASAKKEDEGGESGGMGEAFCFEMRRCSEVLQKIADGTWGKVVALTAQGLRRGPGDTHQIVCTKLDGSEVAWDVDPACSLSEAGLLPAARELVGRRVKMVLPGSEILQERPVGDELGQKTLAELLPLQ